MLKKLTELFRKDSELSDDHRTIDIANGCCSTHARGYLGRS